MFEPVVQYIRELYRSEQFIPLHEPRFTGKEREYVLECIDSTFVSSVGKFVDLFEKQLSQYTGAQYAVATGNGTSALHIAMLVAGVQRNELVITQPLSFIATSNAINYLGAVPVYLDIERATLGLDPNRVAEFLREECRLDEQGHCIHQASGRRVAACVPMHTFGHPVRIDELVAVCQSFNVPVVEDAAESLGSTYKGRHTGTFGLVGTYSFNGNKTITCGGGGAIVTNDERLARRAKHLTTQAKVPHRWEYVHDEIGYNYRMPNLNAALACAQLEQLEEFIANKRQTAHAYERFFTGRDITFVTEPADSRANYWLNAVLLPGRESRNAFLQYTNDHQVMTRPAWQLMHRLPMFADALVGTLTCAEEIEARLANIPSSVRTHG